jgi:hypothetical protein
MAKSSKDELRRLELEEQIAEATKRSTANLESFAEAQKKIRENYKLIQKINLQIQASEEDIVELKKQGLKETSDEIVAIRKRQAALKQDIELIRTTNKELSKGKNFAKAIGNEFVGWGKQLAGSILPSLSGIFSKYMEIDKLAHQTANTLGFQGSKLDLMRNNLAVTRDAYVEMGFTIEDAYKSQMALSEATGRQVMLTKGASIAIAETSRITGMAVEDMAGLTGQMEAFGLGAEQSADFILQMSQEASQMGLNSGKVIKKFEQNLGLLNKLNFKNGIAGLKAMTKFSEKFKLDMNAVASVADKVFRPEGAIEAAAQLQVLGGDLAALGDPFQLMYKARNSPEELAKSLTKAAQASAVFNEKTGEFEVNAYELDRLREAAAALGMDYQALVETAKQGAKIKKFEGLLGGKFDQDTMDALTGAAQMGENGAFVLDAKGAQVLLKDITKEQAATFTNDIKERKELADKAMAMQDRFEAIKNKVMLKFIEIFEQNEPMIKKLFEALKWLADKLISFIDWSVKIFGAKGTLLMGLALYFGGKAALQWGLTAAAGLGKGLLSWAVKGGKSLVSKITGGGGMGKQSSVSSGAKDFLKGQAGGPGQSKQMDDLGKSSSKLGGIASVSAPQILALGAALLMVGGAIYLAATGLATLVEAFKGLTGPQALGAVAGIITVMGGFVAILWAMTLVLPFLGGAAGVAALPLLAFGAAMLMIGGAIAIAALGVSVLVDSFANMFSIIGANGSSLFMAGLGLLAMSAGIIALSASLVVLGAAYLLGGFLGLIALEEAATDIQTAFRGVDPQGINTAVNAINSIDIDKLNALKELSLFMSLMGASTTIKFDESLTIDGTIELSGEGGGKSGTDWIKDPVFISKLKQAISDNTDRERNGGRY